jgi:hypothetical protein
MPIGTNNVVLFIKGLLKRMSSKKNGYEVLEKFAIL